MLLESEAGNFEEGKAYLDRFVEVATQSVPWPNVERAFAAIAIAESIRITGLDDLAGTAEEFSRIILASPSSTPAVMAFARIGSSLLSAFRGDKPTAAKRYAELTKSQAAGYGSHTGMPAGRVLGLIANALGRLEQAAAHFEDGLIFCRTGGYMPALASTCHDYAEALLHPPAGSVPAGKDTRIKVTSLLDEALPISKVLGMHPLAERTVALQEYAAARLGPGPAYPDGLTHREVEVL